MPDSAAARPDPLAALLNDSSITEVIVNGPAEIWIERRGRLQRAALRFDDTGALRDACVRLAARAGRRLDDAQPMVDARLADGSRLNVVLPPLAPDGPLLTLRRFAPRPFTLTELVELGSLSQADADLLDRCVRERLSIVISGGTSSGKTSLLGALAARIDASERIVTVEDAAELRIDRPHVARLEARGASLEGTGEVGIRELVRNALRMRPDRLIVGEVRGGEALDMLQAMTTGHDGSLTTVHAKSPDDALRRIELLALMAGLELPYAAVREQVASAFDVVVQVARRSDGERRLVSIHGVERRGRGLGARPQAACRCALRRRRAGVTACCWPASPRSRASPAALGRRPHPPRAAPHQGSSGRARARARVARRAAARRRGARVPAAPPIARWWPSEPPVERPARRSRWRRAVQQRERTSRPRWRRRSVSVPASPRQRSRCSCAPGATCRRSYGRSLGDSTSGAASMPRSAPSRHRRGCPRASCRSCRWRVSRSPRCSMQAPCDCC